MKRLLFAAAIVCAANTVLAQSAPSNPAMTYGMVPTVGQWNNWFQQKQDTLGFTPVNRAGDSMTGKLRTVAPTTSAAGFSLLPGVSPLTPVDGDLWITSGGLFARVNGSTIGPIGDGTVVGPGTTVIGNVAKWGDTAGQTLVDGGTLGSAATQNTGTSGHNLPFLDGTNTWGAAQSFSSLSSSTPIPATSGGTGLTSVGTAISANTGTSGHALGFLDGANTWSANQTISTGAAQAQLSISANSGQSRVLFGQTAGSNRWAIVVGSSTAENTGNVGSDFQINNYDNTGAYLSTPFSIARATGVPSFAQPIPITSGGTGSTTAAAARTALGLGSIATQNSNAVAITGGSVTGASVSGLSSAIAITDGGTGATTASAARTNLGLGTGATMTVTSGSWTPVLQFGGASTGITYSTQSGSYVRVGYLVYVTASIVLTSKGSATGAVGIAGLPVTASADTQRVDIDTYANMTSMVPSYGFITGSGTSISLVSFGATTQSSLTDTNFTNTTVIRISGVYNVGSPT